MMVKRIVAIPVDPRPVVCAQVVDLVALAGVELVVPPLEMLGQFRVAADCEALYGWLREQANTADGVVLSLDMMLYGGLVPSRFSTDADGLIASRLQRLRDLRRASSEAVRWFAFAATLRISNNNVNEEEKLYWADHGTDIWSWSYHSDRADVSGEAGPRALAEAARISIPQDIQDDYLATRARNFAMLSRALDYVEERVFDRLILPQDDTATFGFNIAERRRLQARVEASGLQDRVAIYSGADEVLHTLCARQIRGAHPARLFVEFSDRTHVGQLTALYEDRPLLESLDAQIAAIGAQRVDRLEDADALVVVHTQGATQGDWAMRRPLAAKVGVDAACWSAIGTAASPAVAKPVAVIDLAYANGGDPEFVDELSRYMPLRKLAAYAAWNTASNAIGSCLAQLVLARGEEAGEKNQRVLCLRFLEDLVYQADVRQRVRAEINESALSAAAREWTVEQSFVPVADAWLAYHHFPWRVAGIRLPWNRTFEIGIAILGVEARA